MTKQKRKTVKAALLILVQRSLDVFGVRRKTGTGYILRANLIKNVSKIW